MASQSMLIVNNMKPMNLRHNKPSFTYTEPELPKNAPRVRKDSSIQQTAQLLAKFISSANARWRIYQREYSPVRSDSPSSNPSHNPAHWEELTEAIDPTSSREQLQSDWEKDPKNTATTLQNMAAVCQDEPQLTPILERMKRQPEFLRSFNPRCLSHGTLLYRKNP